MTRLVGGLMVAASLVWASPATAQTGTISGVITNEVTLAPIAGALVSALAPGVVTVTATTDADGRYTLAVSPRTWTVSARATGYVFEFFDDVRCDPGCSLASATPVAVAAGTTTTVDIALEPKAVIRGRVTSAQSSAALADVLVTAYVSIPSPNGQVETRYAGEVRTDSAGDYAFEVLAGTYYVVTTAAKGYVKQVFDGLPCVAQDCRISSGTPVVVTPGQTAVADFALLVESSISGHVRLTDSTPVTSRLVEVYNEAGSLAGSATTNSVGWYGLGGLPAGTYFVRALHSLYTQYTPALPGGATIYGGDECTVGSLGPDCRVLGGIPVVVPLATAVTGIDLTLRATGSLTGTVRGPAGLLAGAQVSADLGGIIVASAIADANGVYEIHGLLPGTYRMRTTVNSIHSRTFPLFANVVDEWLGGTCVGCPGTPQTVTVTPGGRVTGLDFDLAAGGSIQGRYTCVPTTFFLLAGEVQVYDGSGRLVRYKSLDCRTDGIEYSIVGLAPGTYYVLARDEPYVPSLPQQAEGGTLIDILYNGIVCITADCDVRRGTPVQVAAGQETADIDFVVRAGASVRVPGSDPVLRLYDARGVEITPTLRGMYFGYQEAVGLPIGTYYARIGEAPYGREDCPACPVTMGTPIVITFLGQRVTLSPEHATTFTTVSGTTLDADTDAPLSMIGVELLSANGDVVASGVTDMVGRFSVELAQVDTTEPTTHYARTVNSRGYVDTVYGLTNCPTCAPHTGTPVPVTAGMSVSGIDFRLSRGAQIRGLVTDDTGVPIGDVGVAVMDSSGVLVGRTVGGALGHFEATVPPGTYLVRTEPVTGRLMKVFDDQTCASGQCVDVGGSPVTTSIEHAASAINFRLPACVTMTMTPTILALGSVGDAYRQRLTVSGGTAPFRFMVVDGRILPGLTLDETTGVLAGTPTAVGRSTLRIAAVDASGCGVVKTYELAVTSCSFVLSTSSAMVAAAGGEVEITIADACGSEAVSSPVAWVTTNTSSTMPGRVVLDVAANSTAAPRSAQITIGRRVLSVLQGASQSAPPFGSVGLPLDGSTVSGSIAMGGWALDDLGVTRVRVYRDPVAGDASGVGRILLGTAVFVPGARPDVAALYPSFPFSDRAGWGFLILTNSLPDQGNGVFRLHAFAEDVEGHEILLGSRTIIGTNSSATLPFGAIDTPRQGETIGGASYVNFGWALTPLPKAIPTDGSTIQVMIDGAPVGTVSYNFFRSDVSSIFPGLANSNGPVGFRTIDTTALTEGRHTISWSVEDDNGARSGIGARYFTVSNSTDNQPDAMRAFARLQLAAVPVGVVEGPHARYQTASVAQFELATLGERTVPLDPATRLELRLESGAGTCQATWAGYLDRDGELADLPTGTSLDRNGIFYWEPGPAFRGTFGLIFIRTDCAGLTTRAHVTIVIGES